MDTKEMQKKLHRNYKGRLHAILKLRSLKQQLYGYFSPISETIQENEQEMQRTAGEARINL